MEATMTLIDQLTQYGPGAICVMASGGDQPFECFAEAANSQPIVLIAYDGCSYDLCGRRLAPGGGYCSGAEANRIVSVLPPRA
jgi:hypothetical protein